jgi:hypothetical protein
LFHPRGSGGFHDSCSASQFDVLPLSLDTTRSAIELGQPWLQNNKSLIEVAKSTEQVPLDCRKGGAAVALLRLTTS